jgi:hypothetical protein
MLSIYHGPPLEKVHFMKKLIVNAIVSLILLGLSSSSQAAEKKWEIWTGGLANLNLAFTDGTTATGINIFGTNFFTSPNVGYFVIPGLEVVFSPGFTFLSTSGSGVSGSSVNFNPLLGVNFSFTPEVEDSPFFQLQGGMAMNSTTKASTTTTTTNFQWAAALGKRFKLADGITYAPAIAFQMVTSNPTLSNLSFIPLQFSFLL